MDALPQVGQKYQHKKWGEALVTGVFKLGRGYRVAMDLGPRNGNKVEPRWERLKDFQKATT